MDYNAELELEKLETSLEVQNADAYAAVAKATNKPKYVTGTIAGAGKGFGNIAADALLSGMDALTWGGNAALRGADKVAETVGGDLGTGQEFNQATVDLQGKMRGYVDFIRSEHGEDPAANLAMSMTESVGKYALAYSQLTKMGVKSVIKKSIGAGAIEGATDDPFRQDFEMLQGGLRSLVSEYAPNSLGDFDAAMDVEGDYALAGQASRRVISSLESALFATAGEGANVLVGKGIKAMPEPLKRKIADGFDYALEKTRKMKQWVNGKPTQTFDDFANQIPDNEFKLDLDAVDLDKSFEENLKGSIKSSYSTQRIIDSSDAYSALHGEYVTKLKTAAEELKGNVVSLAKAKGLAEDEVIAKYTKEVGVDFAQKDWNEKLTTVIEGQAANAIYEQSYQKALQAKAAFKDGIIPEDEMLKNTKELFLSSVQRGAFAAKQGAGLRVLQDISPDAQSAYQAVRGGIEDFDDIMTNLKVGFDDPVVLREMNKALDGVMDLNIAFGKDTSEVSEAIISHLKTKKPSNKEELKEFANTLATTYSANLLSGSSTLMQGLFGGYGNALMQASETVIKGVQASMSGTRLRHQATVREGLIEFMNAAAMPIDTVMAASKMAANGLSKITKSGVTHRAIDTTGMTPEVAARMIRTRPTDRLASVDLPESKSIMGHLSNFMVKGVQQPIFGTMEAIDKIVKVTTSQSVLKGRFHTALMVDDAFALGSVPNKGEAITILNSMFRRGEDVITDDMARRMGVSAEKAKEMSFAMNRERRRISNEALDKSLSATLQTPLNGGLKKFQSFVHSKDFWGIGKLQMPFFQSPVNAISQIMQRLPVVPVGSTGTLGLPIHPQFYKDFAAGGLKQQKAISKLVSGNIVSAIGAQMYDKGLIIPTGQDIADKRLADNLYNISSGSIVVGGVSTPLANLSLFGNLMNAGGMVQQNKHMFGLLQQAPESVESGYSDVMMANVMTTVQLMRDLPMAKVLDDLMRVSESINNFDPQNDTTSEAINKYIGTIAGNLVPYSALQRRISNELMDYRTQSLGMIDSFQAQFAPWANIPAFDVFGNEMPTAGGGGAGFLLGSRKVNVDPVLAMAMHGAEFDDRNAPRPQRADFLYRNDGSSSVKIRMSPEQLVRFNQIMSTKYVVQSVVEQLANSDTFKNNADNGRFTDNGNMISSEIDYLRQRAFEDLMGEDVGNDLQIQMQEKLNKDTALDSMRKKMPILNEAAMIRFTGGK